MKLKKLFANLSGCRSLDFLMEGIYLAIIFLIPLWFAYFFPTYNIFELNKIGLFKILVWLFLLLTILKAVFYPVFPAVKPAVFFKKYWLLPTIFIVGLSLTLIGSPNPMLSFYGTMERQQGLSSYLFYFLWFVLLSLNISLGGDSRQKIKRIVITVIASASVVAAYGILQILNIDFLSWPEPPYLTHRTLSSFGQPNFLASWLLLVIPVSWGLFYESRKLMVKFLYFLAGTVQLICLFLTSSRGGLVALFITIFLFLFYFLFSSAWPRVKKYVTGFLFLAVIAVAVLLSNAALPNRWGSLLEYNSGSVGARVNFYLAAAAAIKHRPLLGYGLENSGEVFIRYYEPDWGVYGEVGQSSDRAHNLVLDILLTTGAVGLILFVILYYFFFSLARANIRQRKNPILTLALSGGVLAYLLSLLFSFAIVSSEVYFWLFLALLVAINFDPSVRDDNQNRRLVAGGRRWPIIVVLLFVVLTVNGIAREIRVLIADHYFNKLYFISPQDNYLLAAEFYDRLRAQKTNPINQESYNRIWGEILCGSYSSIDDSATKMAIEQKLAELDQSLSAARFKNVLVKARINHVLGNFTVARDQLSQLIALSPHWPFIYLAAGRMETTAGDFKQALVAYHLAALNLPITADGRLNDQHRRIVRNYQYFINYKIADIHAGVGNWPAAGRYYQAAYQSNSNDFTLLKKIADTYYHRGDLPTAMKYNRHGAVRNPTDYNWPLALAALAYESGDLEMAQEYLTQALELAPDNEELRSLQNQYRP